LGLKDNTPPLAVMVVMEPSSLVQEPRVLVLDDHLEKSSILRAALQAAEALLARAATRPIRVNERIIRKQ